MCGDSGRWGRRRSKAFQFSKNLEDTRFARRLDYLGDTKIAANCSSFRQRLSSGSIKVDNFGVTKRRSIRPSKDLNDIHNLRLKLVIKYQEIQAIVQAVTL